MTLNEYYGFPEGTNVIQRYNLSYFTEIPDLELPANITYLFDHSPIPCAPKLNTSKVTNMYGVFNYCQQLVNIYELKHWDTSNVTNLGSLFYYCLALTDIDISMWNTSKVTNMSSMLAYCTKLKSFGAIDCSSVTYNNYPIYHYSNYDTLTDVGGFLNMKSKWDNTYGLAKCPNLTYESCINVLNGLYDFTGHGETPNSNQGKLKVHANFLTTVGDEISIGTNKGWTITT